MRVERLLVENLGPIERVDLALKPVTILMGPNEQGKSFLLDSLGVLRFGSCRGVKIGESAVLTRQGAKGWAVEAVVSVNADSDNLVLRRTRTTGPDAATLDGAMGDARVWRALLDGRHVLSMKPDERRGLVADLLARDTSDLLEVLAGKGASEPILAAVRDGNLRRAHRLAEEERRSIDRLLSDQETIVRAGADDPVVETKSGPKAVSQIPLDVIERALTEARARWRAAVGASERVKANQRARDDAAAARKELEALPAAGVWGEVDERRLGEVGGLLRRASEEHATATSDSKRLRNEADALRDRLKLAEAACPMCGQPLGDAAKARLREAIELADAGGVRAAEALRKAATDVEALRKEQTLLTEKRGQVAVDKATRSALQKRIAADPTPEAGEPENPEPLDRETRRLEGLRETRLRYDGRAEGVVLAQQRSKDLREKRAVAAEIEACTTPDRIDDEAGALEAINAACAEYAPAILGTAAVRVDSTWEVTYADRRVELASDSALARTGLVLALALSRLSGVGCVFMDRLEALDDPTRAKVVTLLGSLVEKGEVETAIVATVRKEPPAPVTGTAPAWLERVWIEGGKARVV